MTTDDIKRTTKILEKETSMKHCDALNLSAKIHGFENYHHAQATKTAVNQRPAILELKGLPKTQGPEAALPKFPEEADFKKDIRVDYYLEFEDFGGHYKLAVAVPAMAIFNVFVKANTAGEALAKLKHQSAHQEMDWEGLIKQKRYRSLEELTRGDSCDTRVCEIFKSGADDNMNWSFAGIENGYI